MKIGILGTSDIAYRRFLPALKKCANLTYAGVASRTPEKGKPFQEQYGGQIYDGYDALLADESIGAVYVPLPPALHCQWAKKALEAGKHVLLEKPFATSPEQTETLLTLAEEKGLAVHENYMFLYHRQLALIKRYIESGELGQLRLLRMAFGFPKREGNDFRYNRELGGGALLDCGGYPVRLAQELLGGSARVTQGRLVEPEGYEVDLYGSAVLENNEGLCAQVSFGMDNAYQCQLEVWGSKATLIAPRIFTAGADLAPRLILHGAGGETVTDVEPDDQFLHSIERFVQSVEDENARKQMRQAIRRQSQAVDVIRQGGEKT